MNKNIRRRLASIAAACALLLTAVPQVPVSVAAAENLIKNSTFDLGTIKWGMYKESGGAGSLNTKDGKLALKITSTGEVTYAVQMYYDIIPLYQNATYHLSYEISCDKERFVEGMIQQNGGTYQAYTWKGLELSPTPQKVDYEFTMEAETDIMAKLVFNCGNQEADAGKNLGEHTIYLDNVVLELVDDSGVNYESVGPYRPQIKTDQVGYRTADRKLAVFKDAAGQGEFTVVNAKTEQAVYTGKLSDQISNGSANETNWIGDFSEVTAPGEYYIKCGSLDKSYTFTIGDNVYDSMLNDSVRMLYLQRCGTQIQDAAFGHPACHTGMATIYGTNQQIDVSGGWHDAGDYGRYTVAAAKAVADLMYAYLANPDMYGDNIGIPESGNGKADILDETKYELDWMLKMQAADGGVYHKVSCASFPGYVMPQDETKPLIVTPVSSTATADFAASMALAAEVYKEYDSAYAEKCLTAAKKAWSYLEQNPNFNFSNPADITTGEYGDKTDRDERYWAAAQLWRATGDSSYMNAFQTAETGLDWSTVGDYGNIAILTAPDIDKNSAAYNNAKAAIIKQADAFKNTSGAAAYGAAISKYEWGSNMTIANAGVVLGLAANLTGDSSYMDAAKSQLHYLLGVNPLGECFMTGYGTVSPQNPHHRPSMAVGSAMKGMLVGGVNSNLEDSAAEAYCNNEPAAKCYVDNSESYSTNEITIYWNSPLTYLLTVTAGDTTPIKPDPTEPSEPATEPSEPATEPSESATDPSEPATDPIQNPDDKAKYGDVNCDNDITLSDVVLLNKSLMMGTSLSKQGEINADVDRNGKINETDALNILKYVVEIIKSLPVGDAPVPQPTEPQPTEPQPTEPQPTEPQPTEPQPTDPQKTPSGLVDYGTAMNADATAVADFRKGESSLFFASDGWTNGACFNCGWYKQNTSLDNGCLSLTIDKDHSGQYAYSGAEYRTTDFYGYGYFETSMQAIKNDGVVSSFFTYTGESDNNPWDEIDIEILGKDTTKVQLNYYTNGVGNHEYMYDLGFDASEGYHTYGFDWQADHITWYVDGVAVYTAYDNIPKTPGKIMMNTWPGIGVDEWLKPFNGNTPLTAHYQWVTYNR